MKLTFYPFAHQKDAIREVLAECHIAEQFGHILKKARLYAGYPKPKALSEALFDICGVEHSERSIYRYEKGTNSAPIDFLVATSLVISPEIFVVLLKEILAPSLLSEFSLRHEPAIDFREQLKLFEGYNEVRE